MADLSIQTFNIIFSIKNILFLLCRHVYYLVYVWLCMEPVFGPRCLSSVDMGYVSSVCVLVYGASGWPLVSFSIASPLVIFSHANF